MDFGRNQSAPDRAHHSVLWAVHVDQRPDPDRGLLLVGFRGHEYRPWLVGEKIIGALDLHHVGMFGDRLERSIGRRFAPGRRRLGPQMCQRGMQFGLIAVRLRVGDPRAASSMIGVSPWPSSPGAG